MKKVNLILLHEDTTRPHIDDQIFPKAYISSYSFEQKLRRRDIKRRHTAFIIWDAAGTKEGLFKLKELRDDFPGAPVFIVAENPSKEYLMVAIKYRATDLFTLPLKKEELQGAVALSLERKKNERSALEAIRRLAGWLNSGFSRLNTPSGDPDAAPPENPGFSPESYLNISNKDMTRQSPFDLQAQFFGDFVLKTREGECVKIKGKKYASLMAYLLYNHQKSIHKDILMEQFWSDCSPDSARNSLNVAICSIRKSLSPVFNEREAILYESDHYSLNPELEIISDVEQFQLLWRKGRTVESSQGLKNALDDYQKAVGLYKADFLTDMRFEAWCESERENLREVYLSILNRLGVYFYEQRQYDLCIHIGKKMLKNDRCMEEVHRKLMKCYYAIGLGDLALRQYFKCEKILEEEFNMKPSEPTRQLLCQIQNGATLFA